MATFNRFIGLYAAAERRIRRAISGFDPETFSPAIAERIRRETSAIVAVMNREATAFVESDIRLIFDRKVASISKSLDGRPATMKKRPSSLAIRRDKVMASALANLLRANRSIIERIDALMALELLAAREYNQARATVQEFDYDEIADDVRQWARDVVANRESRAGLERLIRNRLTSVADEDGLIEIHGRHYQIKGYAELVASVAMTEAQTEATLAACEQFGNDLVEFSRFPGCDVCNEYIGQIFSISGNDPYYPHLTSEETPPLHPHCRHSLMPTSRAELRVRERER